MTPRQPSPPKRLWAQITFHWIPYDDIDPPQPPIEQHLSLRLTEDNPNTWEAYTDNPPGYLRYDLDYATQSADVYADFQPPNENYHPIPNFQAHIIGPMRWRPHLTPEWALTPLGVPETESWMLVQFNELAPSQRLPEAQQTCVNPTGPIAKKILERTKPRKRHREKALTRPRPTPRQAALNEAFAAAAAYWSDLTPEQKDTWRKLTATFSPPKKTYPFYLSQTILWDPERHAKLEQRIGEPLAIMHKD